jgi:hypothetical protein
MSETQKASTSKETKKVEEIKIEKTETTLQTSQFNTLIATSD